MTKVELSDDQRFYILDALEEAARNLMGDSEDDEAMFDFVIEIMRKLGDDSGVTVELVEQRDELLEH